MSTKKPTTVTEYLAALPKDRKDALQAVRKVIKANLDPAFKEGMQYGMPAFFLPHSVYPDGYHCDPKQPLPFASIASQKNHMGIYLFCVYTTPGEEERFREAWLKTGNKLDMGKSCVRFKKLEDVPLDVLGKAIKRATAKKFVAAYEKARDGTAWGKKNVTKKKTATAKKAPAAARKQATKKVAKKVAKKKTTAKKKARRS